MPTPTIISATTPSGPFATTTDPTWGEADSTTLPSATTVARSGPGATGNITGRGAHLADMFPASALGLTGYDPRTEITKMFNPTETNGGADLLLGTTVTDGAGAYFGAGIGTDFISYGDAPDLGLVKTGDLNIPNPFVPDVSNGNVDFGDAGTAEAFNTTFNAKYPGTQNAFPPAGNSPADALSVATGLDLDAGAVVSAITAGSATSAVGLNPSNTSTRTGGWFSDDVSNNYGRWSADQ